MKKTAVLVLGLSLISSFTQFVNAQTTNTVADWTFETSVPTTAGPYNPEIGSGSATGSHVGAAVYSTPAGNGSAHSFSANTWAVNDYWQFSVSTVGFGGIELSYDQTGSGTGPKNFFLEYSSDNGANFTTAGTYNVALSTWTAGTPATGFTESFDLSSITALDNDPTVIFRIVDQTTTSINNGTVATAGTDRIDNFNVFTVSSTPTPEPSSVALAAMGGVACLFMFRRKK